MIPLSQAAQCINGYTFRTKPSQLPKGRTKIVQTSDITPEGISNPEKVISVLYQPEYKKFLAHEGDIIFRSRSLCPTHTLLSNTETPFMIASPLILIRPNREKILPEYLSWILNNKLIHQYLIRCGQGSILKIIGIKELQQLSFPLPSLDIQKKISETAELLKKQQALAHKIQQQEFELISNQLWQLASNKGTL